MDALGTGIFGVTGGAAADVDVEFVASIPPETVGVLRTSNCADNDHRGDGLQLATAAGHYAGHL